MKTIDYRTPRVTNGMTLIELLVVTTIVLMLVVISIPAVKPMLASRKQADAAQTLSTFLTQARLRAAETGRPCGVMFERYTANNYTDTGVRVYPNNDACVVVRQVEVPPPYGGWSENSRVRIDNGGNLTFSATEAPYWNALVKNGDLIQFDSIGPYYTIANAQMSATGTGVTLNWGALVARHAPNGCSFKVLRAPQPTLAAPIGFPTGIVVDLEYSGVNNGLTSSTAGTPPPPLTIDAGSDFRPVRVSTTPTPTEMDRSPVYVMFSPSGEVQRMQTHGNDDIPNGPIHFLIGRWERTGSDWYVNGSQWARRESSAQYLPEDGLRNYEDMTNYWVSIQPRTGTTYVNPVAPYQNTGVSKNPISESRRYANTLQFNTGGN